MYANVKLKQSAARENVRYWMVNAILAFACMWTFLLLGGCKPQPIAQNAIVQESKEDISKYLNNSINEVTPPEIMNYPSKLPAELNETPPVTSQVNASF